MIDYPEIQALDDERHERAARLGAAAVKTSLVTLLALALTVWGLEYYVSVIYWGISPDWYQLSEDGETITFRCQDYAPVEFQRAPASGVTRILVLGGSNPFGYPERPKGEVPLPQRYGFIGALQLAADQQLGGSVEFVNLSVNGGSSADALRLLRRAEGWGASGAILYTGHSEAVDPPEDFIPELWGSALYRAFKSVGTRRPPRAEGWVEAPWVGSPRQAAAIQAQLKRNLRSIAGITSDMGIPVVAVIPAVNLAGLDPSWSTTGEDYDMRALWEYDGRALEGIYQERRDIAEVDWVLGQQRLAAGRDPTGPLLDAVDADGLPWRATSGVRQTIEQVAEAEGWFMADAMEAVRPRAGAAGDEQFYDNAHPRPAAARAIAQAIAQALALPALIPTVPAIAEHSLSSGEAADAAISTAKYWIRWACIREYDPSLRLDRAEAWIDRALQARPGDPEAVGLRAVLARLRGDPSPPPLPADPALRRGLDHIHPTVTHMLDGQ